MVAGEGGSPARVETLETERSWTEEMFSAFDIKSIKIMGRFVTLVVSGDGDDIEKKLAALSPAVMDRLDVDFEEAFIGDLDRKVRGEG